MEVGAALTLFFAGVGAVTGALTIYNDWARRRADRIRERDSEEALWSLETNINSEPSYLDCLFQYDAARAKPVTVRGFAVVEPVGAEIALANEIRIGHHWRETKLVPGGDWSPELQVNFDLDAEEYDVGPGHRIASKQDYGRYTIMARLTRPSAGKKTRLRIRVTVEDRSAARRQRKIVVTSQEIAWTASSADKTT